jgi:ribosomal protein L16 Arg81 hydroxylase
VQLVGRKRVILVSANELPRLYNDHHVFSLVRDLADPGLDLDLFPLLREVKSHEVIIEPGEILFIPIGWWHQLEALDFSVSLTYTNFRWKNDFHQTYPFDD